jgi:hypothetical protein
LRLLEGDYFMTDTTPLTPIDASLGALDSELNAVGNLKGKRGNAGALRSMFGVFTDAPDAAVKAAEVETSTNLKRSSPTSRPPQPSI